MINRCRGRKIAVRFVEALAGRLLDELKVGRAELNIVFTGVRAMTRLNETFLGHRGPTDVIAFGDSPGPGKRRSPAHGRHGVRDIRGEIVVCPDEARRQAKQFRTTWQAEMVRYIIHGLLHLIGHDDSRPGPRRRMKREEDRLLRRLSAAFSLAAIAGGS
ncbi:MAG: rRNA maturation RNase YbeY [Verrucomicrobiota bacterium]|nr:rRNA maturation RNase YbeY [Verrucomicrobiota bacterium]